MQTIYSAFQKRGTYIFKMASPLGSTSQTNYFPICQLYILPPPLLSITTQLKHPNTLTL